MRTHLVLGEGGVFSPRYASQQPFMVSAFSGHLFLPLLMSNWSLNFSRPGPGSLDRNLQAGQRHLSG